MTVLLRYGVAVTAVILSFAACNGGTAETSTTLAAATTTTSVAATSTTSMATTTTVDPHSVARLDGTWYVTYRVVDNEFEGVDFDDFGGMSQVGDIDAARVWILEHQCDEGVCDVDLDSRRPEAPSEDFLETVLLLREDGTYGWEPQGEVGFGACVVDDGELFEDAFEDVVSIELEVTDAEPSGDGWVATSMSGTRISEASPVDEAETAGCEISWRTVTEVEAVRTDPEDPVPEYLPAGSDPIIGRIGYLHLGPNRSPDGIWSVDPDEADMTPILEIDDVNGFAWSPDATRLVYSTEQGELWVAGADGSNSTVIGQGSLPAWSPDGSELAFVRPRLDGAGEEVWVMSTVTGATRSVTTWEMTEVEATWADSDRLVVSGIDPGETDPAMRVLNVEVDETTGLVFGSSPEVSPDSSRVAFVFEGRLWTTGLDATGVRQITDGPDDRDPTWSPDGRQIAFIRDGSIWVVSPDGSDQELIVGDATSPAWSPRG